MPPFNFYRRRWYPNRRWRWRRRARAWRPRQTIRRRFRRRRWVRRRRFHRRFKRKLSKITLKQWQPKSIVKCNIKGNLCLFACGRYRTNHNYIITCESFVPVSEPGGGAWSILQFSLRVLYDEFVHARNWWTHSNQALPLARFLGSTFRFYRSAHTNYIVTPITCPPFEVTKEIYLDTQPSRRLMDKRSFVVPQLGRGPMKKTYIKKKFKPPSLFLNKWYFQQDIYNTPLIAFITTACSFDQMYAPSDQISTNITLNSLNTRLFQQPNYKKIPYSPKVTGTIQTYLWSYQNGHNETQINSWQHIVLLANIQQYSQGQPTNSNNFTSIKNPTADNKQQYGNPFIYYYRQPDVIIYYGSLPKQQITNQPEISPITSLFQQCRYNPFRDKGTGNKVYWKPTDVDSGSLLSLPTDTRLITEDLPLWLILWGIEDWTLKSKPITHLYEEYQLVIQSPYIEPVMPCYVFLDDYFVYPKEHKSDYTETDYAHWHPKYAMQVYALETIAKSGPATPKINTVKQIQAHTFYNFHFKWGGCPAPMELITDPAKQEKFPTPYNQLQGLEIQDPTTPKELYLYTWDERQNQITEPAAKRLKKDYTSSKLFTGIGPKDIPLLETQQKTYETSDEEEEKETTNKLQQLRDHRRQLRHRLHQLLKKSKFAPLL
nr:MAG: ORF1 [TTV-like mini virus]